MSTLPAGFSITTIGGKRCTAVPKTATSISGQSSFISTSSTTTTSSSSSTSTSTSTSSSTTTTSSSSSSTTSTTAEAPTTSVAPPPPSVSQGPGVGSLISPDTPDTATFSSSDSIDSTTADPTTVSSTTQPPISSEVPPTTTAESIASITTSSEGGPRLTSGSQSSSSSQVPASTTATEAASTKTSAHNVAPTSSTATSTSENPTVRSPTGRTPKTSATKTSSTSVARTTGSGIAAQSEITLSTALSASTTDPSLPNQGSSSVRVSTSTNALAIQPTGPVTPEGVIETNDSRKMNVGAIAGGAAGVFALAAVVILFLWFLRRRKRQRDSFVGSARGSARSAARKSDVDSVDSSTPLHQRLAAAIGAPFNSMRSGALEVASKLRSTLSLRNADNGPGVNLNRGHSQFIEVDSQQQHSRNNSSIVPSSPTVPTTREKLNNWLSRVGDGLFSRVPGDNGDNKLSGPFTGPQPTMAQRKLDDFGTTPNFAQLLARDNPRLRGYTPGHRSATSSWGDLGPLPADLMPTMPTMPTVPTTTMNARYEPAIAALRTDRAYDPFADPAPDLVPLRPSHTRDQSSLGGAAGRAFSGISDMGNPFVDPPSMSSNGNGFFPPQDSSFLSPAPPPTAAAAAAAAAPPPSSRRPGDYPSSAAQGRPRNASVSASTSAPAFASRGPGRAAGFSSFSSPSVVFPGGANGNGNTNATQPGSKYSSYCPPSRRDTYLSNVNNTRRALGRSDPFDLERLGRRVPGGSGGDGGDGEGWGGGGEGGSGAFAFDRALREKQRLFEREAEEVEEQQKEKKRQQQQQQVNRHDADADADVDAGMEGVAAGGAAAVPRRPRRPSQVAAAAAGGVVGAAAGGAAGGTATATEWLKPAVPSVAYSASSSDSTYVSMAAADNWGGPGPDVGPGSAGAGEGDGASASAGAGTTEPQWSAQGGGMWQTRGSRVSVGTAL